MGIDSGNNPQYPGSDDPLGGAQPPLQPPAEPPHPAEPVAPTGHPYEPGGQPPQQPYQPPQPQQPPQQQQPYQSGHSPYQQPQQGPYNQPPGSYEQQPGQQAPMGGQFTGGTYNPPPGYESPPQSTGQKKGGFNWLMCCGISCGVLLLIGILMMVFGWKFIQPFVQMGMEAEKVSTEVKNTDIMTIQATAVYIDAPSLMANPDAYMDQWLAVEGVISANQEVAQSAGGDQGTPYMVDGGLIITDTSYSAPVGVVGETIVGYGKLMVIDMSTVPFMKQILEEAEKTDPQAIGMFNDGKIMIFIAKEVHPMGMEGGGEVADDPNAAGWSQ